MKEVKVVRVLMWRFNEMKRTCKGCRAFDTDGRFVKCDLGYKQEKIWGRVFQPNTAKPLEECPKPRTYQHLMELV